MLLAVAVALLAAAYFGYEKFMASPATPEIAEAPKRPVTPSETLNAIAAAPAKAIQKAEGVVTAVNARESASRNELQGSEETPGKSAAKAAPAVAGKPVAAVTSTTQLAPGLSMTTTSSGVAGDASPAFRSWVVQARVSGVFQGTPARILINGRMVTSGELVDETLAITFERIDAATSTLVFRDRTGATVARRF
jgi:hypothetical protein